MFVQCDYQNKPCRGQRLEFMSTSPCLHKKKRIIKMSEEVTEICLHNLLKLRSVKPIEICCYTTIGEHSMTSLKIVVVRQRTVHCNWGKVVSVGAPSITEAEYSRILLEFES
jgi:hypothetical protein